jgi:hypothetical protein
MDRRLRGTWNQRQCNRQADQPAADDTGDTASPSPE